LLGFRDTFKHVNVKRLSKGMITGIQRDQAFISFTNVLLVPYQLTVVSSGVQVSTLSSHGFTRDQNLPRREHHSHTPACTHSGFSVIREEAFRIQTVLSPK